MLVERRARAQEHRVVPETIARFMAESAPLVSFNLVPNAALAHTFDPGPTPGRLHRFEKEQDWRLPRLVSRYPRFSTDRKMAEEHNLEWVTPGHPLFEALRRTAVEEARASLAEGASFYSLRHDQPARLDFYRARVVDGLGHIVHERLFVIELSSTGEPVLREASILGDFQPAPAQTTLPDVAAMPACAGFLQEQGLAPFLEEVKAERVSEVERIRHHVELLSELIARVDDDIGRCADEKEQNLEGAPGRLAIAIEKHDQLCRRREQRRAELERQQALSLQAVERMASALILPHPERAKPELRNLRPNPENEQTAMRVAMDHERAAGRAVADVHEKDLGYDPTSLDTRSGELRLIEVKGLAASEGPIIFTPNEHRVAEDRRDCYWLYVVTDCASERPKLQAHKDPARFRWREVTQVAHYTLLAGVLGRQTENGSGSEPVGGNGP